MITYLNFIYLVLLAATIITVAAIPRAAHANGVAVVAATAIASMAYAAMDVLTDSDDGE